MATAEVEELNPRQQKILDCLDKNGPMCRAAIVNDLGMPRSTIFDNIQELIGKKIKKFSRQVNPRGRPVVFYKLTEE